MCVCVFVRVYVCVFVREGVKKGKREDFWQGLP